MAFSRDHPPSAADLAIHRPNPPNSPLQEPLSQEQRTFIDQTLHTLQQLQQTSTGPITTDQVRQAIVQVMANTEANPTPTLSVSYGQPIAREAMDSEVEKYVKEIQANHIKNLDVKFKKVEIDGDVRHRVNFDADELETYFKGVDPYQDPLSAKMQTISIGNDSRDIMSALCSNIELAVEIGKHLRPEDILNLYIASRTFRAVINVYMLSTIRTWISSRCPEAGHIFPFKFYRKVLIPDPIDRTWEEHYTAQRHTMSDERAAQVRTIPGLKYLQLVLGRDRYCREIIAILARSGHRLPPTMYSTLLRLWLLMDMSTTRHRMYILENRKTWTDYDLYNAQLFFIKLALHFNDPVFGPTCNDLVFLMMGQKGLYPLWQLLFRKKYTTLTELITMKVRYDYVVPESHIAMNIESKGKYRFHGVAFDDIGTVHIEGWGELGLELHLCRPDEVIPLEAVRRGLNLDMHIRNMMLWGYFDWHTGENLVPTEEEMYITDDENKLAHMDTRLHWKKKHCLKKRWHTLTPEQQQEIMDDEEDDRLRALAWCGNESDDEYPGPDAPDVYDLNDEINRGYILHPQPKDHRSTVPQIGDNLGWQDFINRALIGQPPDITQDEEWDLQAFVFSADDFEQMEDDKAKIKPERSFDFDAWLLENKETLTLLEERLTAAREQKASGESRDDEEAYDADEDEDEDAHTEGGDMTGETLVDGKDSDDEEMGGS